MGKNFDWHKNKGKVVVKHGGSGGIWFLGFIGSLVYFIQYHSGTPWLVTLAVLKSIVWPAFLVYYVFFYLNL